ncbi:unnamed protein product [Protopolystoma xenopodis]|uniref:Uncharacterized protein n=1 Tax=Protopolystoma xenopodis TaxID=117903 RepID=A0A448X2M8_9PLAT|nr:unnamed protein product [Protopolystoma xenopodis]
MKLCQTSFPSSSVTSVTHLLVAIFAKSIASRVTVPMHPKHTVNRDRRNWRRVFTPNEIHAKTGDAAL